MFQRKDGPKGGSFCMKKVVLAYSGGLDTSVIIPWLKETYGYEVIAMAADIGQGEELEHLEEKALKSGASKIYIEDLREEFVTDFVFPHLEGRGGLRGQVPAGHFLCSASHRQAAGGDCGARKERKRWLTAPLGKAMTRCVLN
jgi:argininosuccinate synthase